MTNLIIFFAAVIISIVVGTKTKTNIGFWAIAFACVIGFFMFNTGGGKVINNNFPIAVFFNMVACSTFFGFANMNGAITVLAAKLRYGLRKASWLGPISVYLLSALLTFCGANAFVVAPFTFSLAVAMGMNPFLGVAACNLGQNFLLMPFCQTGATNVGIISKYFTQEQAYAGMYTSGTIMVIFAFVEYIVLCFIFHAFDDAKKNALDIQKPEEFTPIQKKNIIVIAAMLILLIVPTLTQVIAPNPTMKKISNLLSPQLLWVLGSIALVLLGCGSIREVLTKRVSWDTLMLVIGMSILFGYADDLGVVDTLAEMLFKVPAGLIIPVLAAFCGVLSLFVSGSIITPMFVAFAESISGVTGVSLSVVLAAITGGAFTSSISPVSAGGAGALTGCSDEEARPAVIKNMTKVAIINIILIMPYFFIISKIA